MSSRLLLILFALTVFTISSAAEERTLGGGELPATYVGVLPCADCEGIKHKLNVRPDQVFHLRLQYLGKGAGKGDIFDELGVWELSQNGDTLTLHRTIGIPFRFLVRGPDVLSKLDLDDKEIDTELNYELERSDRFQPFEPSRFLRGLYSNVDDVGVFRECTTQLPLVVVEEGQYKKMEEAYFKQEPEPGQEILCTVTGRLAKRPSDDGQEREVLVVEDFSYFWPGETCGRWIPIAELEDSYWKLVILDDRPVIVRPGEREPYLSLASDGGKVSGFGGCNQFHGSYEIVERDLKFSPMAMTQMMCPQGMEREQAFARALEDTKGWKVFGDQLYLYDSSSNLLARFEIRFRDCCDN